MKQKLTLCLLLLSLIGLSQAPELINYQGIARDANGIAILGSIDLKFELHQGGSSSAIVFTEVQTVTTSSLGLFSTQIGKASNLNTINWQSGSLFLEVSLSLSGGTYTSLGTQQLVSVPYSMLAKSVPASYTNNILTIGSNVFTLSPSAGAVYTASTGISITSGSIITNTAPDIPVTFTSTSSNIAVNGSYPNFSISYTPPASPINLTLSGADNNSLSAGSNTVVLNTYTPGPGLTMTGGPNYTLSSSIPAFTIVGLGAAVVSPTTGSSFSVSVANPTLSSSGNSITITQGTLVTTATVAATPATSLNAGTNVSITGTNPYTIASTPTLNLLTANTLSISGGNSITIAPTVSVSGNGSLSVGPLSNSVNIAPSLLGTGAVSVSGTFPNYTIFATPAGSVTVISTSVTGTGLATITSTATNVYNVDVASPVFTPSGPVSISGSYPNYTINSSSAATYTNGTGISITSGSVISNTSPGITPTLVITATTAAGPSVISSGSSFSINVPPALVSALGNTITITQGTVVTTATVASTPNTSVSAGGGGIASITNPVTNSFVISVPGPSLTSNGNTLTLTQGTAVTTATLAGNTYTNGTGISITSGSIITNTSPDQAVTITNSGNIGITGSYPNFALSAPSASFTPGGVVAITTISANSYSVGVPGPSLTSNGNTLTITQGTAVSTATLAGTTYTNGTGISITSGSIITNTSPDQAVTITNSGNIGITGSYPNFALSAPSASFTPGGVIAITTISANSYSIGVPNPTFTSNGPSSITGTYPNLTINSPGTTTYTNGTGISITSGSIITNTSPDQVVTITNSGNVGITGSYPNFALSAPSASFTPGGVVAITTISANSYSIGVPAPTLTIGSGNLSISGGNSVVLPVPGIAVSFTTAANPAVTATGNSFNINIPPTVAPNITTSSSLAAAGIATTSANNFNINIPSANFVTGGVVTISTVSANSYSVGVPAPTLTIGSGNLSISAGNSVALPVPAIAVSFTTAANPAVTATGNSFNINIPPTIAPNITLSTSLTTAGISTTSANNFNINVPTPNIAISQSAGAVGITTTSINNYNINIPLANGAWALLGNAGTTPGTNFIGTSDNTDLHFRTNNTFAMSINALGSVGIGTTSALAKLHVSNASASAETGAFEMTNSSGTGHALVITSASSSQYALRTLNTNASLTSYAGMFEGGLIARGKNNLNSAFAFKAQEIGGSDLFVVRNDGSIGIRNSNPGFDLSIYNSGTSTAMQFRNGSSAGLGFIIGQNNIATNILSYESTSMYFGNGGTNQMVLSSGGNLGIGNMTPAGKLDVTGNTILTGNLKIVDGNQAANKVLTSDAAGNANWQAVFPVPSGAIMAYGGTAIPSGWLLCDGSSYLRTTYPTLFTAISTAWGAADGTHFNVPDMRGMFLRGVDGTAGNDPDKTTRVVNNNAGGNSGNNVGSEQPDLIKGHTHDFNIEQDSYTTGALLGLGNQNAYTTNALGSNPVLNTTNTNGTGLETRPRNVYVYYIIKQ